MLKHYQTFIFIFLLFCVLGTCDEFIENLRGVPPQLASLYIQGSEFECLDGSKKISIDYVNDDYCDCADGSDEPGTSACANGHFYCQNNGFRPLTIPSSHVSDFICDCCDGSDEWLSGVECPNVCQMQGEKWREESKQFRKMQEAGYAKRVELSKAGLKLVEDKKENIKKLQSELENIQPLKTSLEASKNSAEEREREAKDKHESAWNALKEEYQLQKDNEFFALLDSNKDSKVDVPELETFVKSNGEASEEDLKALLGENFEFDVASFREISQKVNLLVKRIIEDNNKKKTEEKQVFKTTDDLVAETTTISPSPPIMEEEEHDNEDDTDGDKDNNQANNTQSNNEEEVPRPPYDEATQALINEADAARQSYDNVLQRVSVIENDISSAENLLQSDYGPDYVWMSLKGLCTVLTTTQYTYTLCLFDRTSQKDLNGHSEVILGSWGSWAGPENNKYLAQKYDKGQSCWNGPERSTFVDFQCGVELQLVDATEPSKCEYRFLVKSPIACKNPAEMSEHEEL